MRYIAAAVFVPLYVGFLRNFNFETSFFLCQVIITGHTIEVKVKNLILIKAKY